MSNLLTLFSFACSAFALIYGLWFANSMYFGFSFIPSKLEKILKIGIATRSDVAQYMDIGGLDKDSKFYGLDINNANFKYDEKTSRLINYSLFTSYKTTGILSAAAPADVRAALNKACDATDNQWVITDGFMTYKGNNLMCLYHKDDKGYLLSVSFEPTSSPVPIASSAPIVTPEMVQFICGDASAISAKLKSSQDFYGDVVSTVSCDENSQKTKAEMLICNNPNLRLAEKLSAVSHTYAYENATKQEVNHTTFAKQNLTAQQNACKDESCLCDIFIKETNDAYGGTSPYVKNAANQIIAPSITTPLNTESSSPVVDVIKPLLNSNESKFPTNGTWKCVRSDGTPWRTLVLQSNGVYKWHITKSPEFSGIDQYKIDNGQLITIDQEDGLTQKWTLLEIKSSFWTMSNGRMIQTCTKS
jgi:hypothetical protein